MAAVVSRRSRLRPFPRSVARPRERVELLGEAGEGEGRPVPEARAGLEARTRRASRPRRAWRGHWSVGGRISMKRAACCNPSSKEVARPDADGPAPPRRSRRQARRAPQRRPRCTSGRSCSSTTAPASSPSADQLAAAWSRPPHYALQSWVSPRDADDGRAALALSLPATTNPRRRVALVRRAIHSSAREGIDFLASIDRSPPRTTS